MVAITRDRLHELVDALAEAQLDAAGQALAALVEAPPPPATLVEPGERAAARRRLAAARRPPLDADAFAVDFWPAERSAAEQVETVDRWRREGGDA
jgi:hypothetical protein